MTNLIWTSSIYLCRFTYKRFLKEERTFHEVETISNAFWTLNFSNFSEFFLLFRWWNPVFISSILFLVEEVTNSLDFFVVFGRKACGLKCEKILKMIGFFPGKLLHSTKNLSIHYLSINLCKNLFLRLSRFF